MREKTNRAARFASEGAGIRALAAAIVARAVEEAHAGDRIARAWLIVDGPLWLDALGLNGEVVGSVDSVDRAIRRRVRRERKED